MAALPDAEHLRSLFDYDQDTGLLVWKVDHNRQKAGSVAGYLNKAGYRYIILFGRRQLAHRIAWALMNGVWPTQDIDHIDGDRGNNSAKNLRHVSRAVNMQNRRAVHRNNKSGFLGVYRNGSGWAACLRHSGRAVHLGTYSTPDLAHQAYVNAKRQIHEGCTL